MLRIPGKVWKEQFWLVQSTELDLMTQAETKEEIPEMMKDAIELLVDDVNFKVNIKMENNGIIIEANDEKKLIALMLKRQRTKNNLTLEQVAKAYGAKSTTDYARYEYGEHMPSIDKLDEILEAINPNNKLVLSF